MSLRDDWKQTGTGLGHAFRDLGKSIVKSAVKVTKKAEDWAESDDSPAANTAPIDAEVVEEPEKER